MSLEQVIILIGGETFLMLFLLGMAIYIRKHS